MKMTALRFGRLILGCLAIVCGYWSCEAWKGLHFTDNPDLVDKKMVGDAVVTHNDVTMGTCAVSCALKYPCGAFSYNAQARVCTFCSLCGNFSLLNAPDYRLYVITKEEPVESSYDQANLCPSGTATPSMCWEAGNENYSYVSAGPTGVWGVDTAYYIQYKEGTYQNLHSFGTVWTDMSGLLVQFDVGTDIVWGVNMYDQLFYKPGISSSTMGGAWVFQGDYFKWISVSPGGSLWSITSNQLFHHTSSWQLVSTGIQRVDAGLAGVWVLNTSGHLLHRLGTYGDTGSVGTEWKAVEGTFQSVASGSDVVVVVDTAGHVWLRSGIGSDTPTGLAWLRYPGKMKQVDVYQTQEGAALWGLNDNNQVSYSILNG